MQRTDFWGFTAIVLLLAGQYSLARRFAALSEQDDACPLVDESLRAELRRRFQDEAYRLRVFALAERIAERSYVGLVILHSSLVDCLRAENSADGHEAVTRAETFKMVSRSVRASLLEQQYLTQGR